MPFLDEDFLPASPAARDLYHRVAAAEPIIDYHCHLSPQDIAEDRRFDDLHQAWLAGDHYKWRAMRADGVPEDLITGGAPPLEKFRAWARTVPHTLRNPLFHWTHLELRRHFGIETLLEESTADLIWQEANRQLATADLSARGSCGGSKLPSSARLTTRPMPRLARDDRRLGLPDASRADVSPRCGPQGDPARSRTGLGPEAQ